MNARRLGVIGSLLALAGLGGCGVTTPDPFDKTTLGQKSRTRIQQLQNRRRFKRRDRQSR